MIAKLLSVVSVCLLLLKGSADVSIDNLLLTEKEIPAAYVPVTESRCQSIQAETFYENPDLYEMIIGKVRSKRIQNFDNKKDAGAIMYFEFENDFKADDFLSGLLWGGSKPSREHPEELYSKGRFLVIWSFRRGSQIQKLSQEKVKKALNQ